MGNGRSVGRRADDEYICMYVVKTRSAGRPVICRRTLYTTLLNPIKGVVDHWFVRYGQKCLRASTIPQVARERVKSGGSIRYNIRRASTSLKYPEP